jgi:redox-sensitive bicupin YhaK (pirin superfamily)
MSFQEAAEPQCDETRGSVELVIRPKEKDLGEFTVRRVLPAPERRMVGSFIFFDHMGPAEFPPGQGIQVRPHPHIGISTVTYLFEGEIMHRDNLGFVQPIQCGAVNLMTAGSGIVHSERAGDDLDEASRLHGIQSWMALPDGEEERDAAFQHYPAADIPQTRVGEVSLRVIIGEAYGHTSPVHAYSSTLYLECVMPAGSELALPDQYEEIGAYVVSGSVTIDGEAYGEGVMAVGGAGNAMTLTADEESLVMIIGGEPLGERHIYWNFVSSSKERIEQAKSDWRERRFGDIPGEHEFIPLPD